ncbi:MAG TPA: AraC family transcriptional regulator [Caulobacterales bacterium]|nr:AraC family transcriptional regulator [Caulobacterales bacterium]
MEFVASGRIVFWEGGSLWVFDVPEEPPASRRVQMHAHHAFQVTMAIRGAFTLQLEDRALGGPVAVVAPDVRHSYAPLGLTSLLFVEPESRAGRVLATRLAGAPAASLDDMRGAAEDIESALRTKASDDKLRDIGQRMIREIVGVARSTEPDRRVRLMVQHAREHLDAPLSLSDVARRVGLSPSRASHLFVEETGLPFRTYLLWLRVSRAVDAYAGGASLTEAAVEAGFADSAHLSRTFRRMFGLSAATLEML